MERVSSEGVANVLGLSSIDDIFTIPFRELKEKQHVGALSFCGTPVEHCATPSIYMFSCQAPHLGPDCFPLQVMCAALAHQVLHAAIVEYPAQELLVDMGIPPSSYPRGLPHRAVYCSRTLNLRSIQACTSSSLMLPLPHMQQLYKHEPRKRSVAFSLSKGHTVQR